MAKNVAWYFNVSKWRPNRDEWLKLTSSIGKDDLERINKFVFKDDSKASLIGSALIRRFLNFATGFPSNVPALRRTQYGRPIVCEEFRQFHTESLPKVLDFNVSHSGDYCILAGVWSDEQPPNISVGVDVTKIVRKRTKQELDRFLDLMSRREFTRSEWETVDGVSGDRQKCINFTRLWCLKESYIKSIGLGLSFKLSRIDFRFDSGENERAKYEMTVDKMKNNIIDTTTVLLDGVEATDWRFFETALDEEHLVAIAYNMMHDVVDGKAHLIEQSPFQEITIDLLSDSLNPIYPLNEEDWLLFASKNEKPR